MLANGDKTGYGFHGDFLNGWNPTTLKSALQQCANTDNGGQISACAPLMQSNSDQASYNCPQQPSVINETVTGLLNSLPGCNPISSGPAADSPANHVCSSNTTAPSINPSSSGNGPFTTFIPQIGTTDGNWAYAGCASDSPASRSLGGPSFANDSMTNELCQAFCAKNGLPLAGVEYGRECYCGLSINPSFLTGKACTGMICAGNRTEYCGAGSLLSLWNSTTYSGPRQIIPSSVGQVLSSPSGQLKYLGCANDNAGGHRALNNASSIRKYSCSTPRVVVTLVISLSNKSHTATAALSIAVIDFNNGAL